VTTLTTARLILTPVSMADLPELAAFHADPEIGGRLKHGILSRSQTAALVADYEAGWRALGLGIWTLRARRDNALIGFGGLWLHDAGHGIGLRGALVPEARGQGYMPEAMQAAIDFAFGRLKLARIIAVSRADNVAAHRAAEHMGMRRDLAFTADDGTELVRYALDRPA
jgi:RimJ/RimL family protein N-acetyltransferase